MKLEVVPKVERNTPVVADSTADDAANAPKRIKVESTNGDDDHDERIDTHTVFAAPPTAMGAGTTPNMAAQNETTALQQRLAEIKSDLNVLDNRDADAETERLRTQYIRSTHLSNEDGSTNHGNIGRGRGNETDSGGGRRDGGEEGGDGIGRNNDEYGEAGGGGDGPSGRFGGKRKER